jgi:hypothetical protein
LGSWEGANAEQKEARKQARTDAKVEFVRETAQPRKPCITSSAW